MRLELNKKIIIHLLIALWFVFSLGYIKWDLWDDFRIRRLTLALEQGQINAINQIIKQTDTECEPLRLFSEETEVNLINVVCLEQDQGQKQEVRPELFPVVPGQ